LNPEVLSRVPITLDRDLRYFRDRYQGIPAQGYTAMITNLLDHPFIEVKLKTTYAQISKKISPQKTFYTGSIDEFFDYKLGTLQYRSCRFVDELKRQAQFQPVAVVNYPETQDFTRIIEHKHFLNEHTPHTLITYEYPEAFKLGRNERFYPLNDQDNNDLFARYQKLARQQPDVVFFGRLGDYRYYDMDQVIARALEIKI
ncbi:UDP-galactopyranose mutase, partial [bacterium]|nr:UDP-galactopyranose mutase [bacterium]